MRCAIAAFLLLVSACATAPEIKPPPPAADPYLAVILPAAKEAAPEARTAIARERMRGWVWSLAAPPSAPEPQSAWVAEGLGDFLAIRARLRAGLATPEEAAAEFDAALKAHDAAPAQPNAARALLLALKWDEDVRQKSAGALDLDDVMKAAHERRALVPTETTGFLDRLLNAAWGGAQVNLRDDLARYITGRARIAPSEAMFGGCLVSTTVLTHGFDTGFDHQGSLAAKTVRGVVRNGPAWMSGLRNGMKLESLSLTPGDTTREVVAATVDARGRKRTIRYWPYADEDREVRKLQLRQGMTTEQTAACGKAMAGL